MPTLSKTCSSPASGGTWSLFATLARAKNACRSAGCPWLMRRSTPGSCRRVYHWQKRSSGAGIWSGSAGGWPNLSHSHRALARALPCGGAAWPHHEPSPHRGARGVRGQTLFHPAIRPHGVPADRIPVTSPTAMRRSVAGSARVLATSPRQTPNPITSTSCAFRTSVTAKPVRICPSLSV